MNLYLISQDINTNYGTYDSAVVCAESTVAARIIHPAGDNFYFEDEWAAASQVKVTKIGVADKKCKKNEVICASYHAG